MIDCKDMLTSVLANFISTGIVALLSYIFYLIYKKNKEQQENKAGVAKKILHTSRINGLIEITKSITSIRRLMEEVSERNLQNNHMEHLIISSYFNYQIAIDKSLLHLDNICVYLDDVPEIKMYYCFLENKLNLVRDAIENIEKNPYQESQYKNNLNDINIKIYNEIQGFSEYIEFLKYDEHVRLHAMSKNINYEKEYFEQS